jgi:DNA replication protein DnaC
MREQRQPTSKVELECANADLFFLDDVHAAELWPWLQRFYYNVFNKRANREKRRPGETLTFITTNEPMEDARGLTPWLSHPVADRLNMGLTLINMTGESYRSQLQGKNYHW